MKQLVVKARRTKVKWPLRKKKIQLAKDDTAVVLSETKNQLKHVRSKWPEVNALVTRLDALNEDNHFTQLITQAMQGGGR